MVKLNRSNATAPPVAVRSVTVALTAAEPHRRTGSLKRTPTKRVTRWSKPKLPNLDSTGVGYAIPLVCWVSIGIRSAAILKKSSEVLPVNPKYVGRSLILSLKVDESWSFVGSKQRQRWLWWVEEAMTGEIVAFVFGRRTHQTFRTLMTLLKESHISVKRWITDAWWSYFDCLDQSIRIECKALLQSLERKHLTLRTRIKRLARRTICFSKSILVHDTIIGLFINQFFFGCKLS